VSYIFFESELYHKCTRNSESKGAPLGGSIADRLRALQDSGLALGQTKLREHTNLPTPPISPRNFQSTPQFNPPASIAPSTSTSGRSMHAFVSPSSLGPPSPSSTPSSSPPNISQLNTYDFTGFNQAFPSIDELDEGPTLSLPSVPTGIGGTSHQDRNGDPSPSPLGSFRNFTVPIERPSSTPITHTSNAFSSRPPSPNKSTIQPKPSTLSNGVSSVSSKPKLPIPVKNIAFPKDLLAYIRDHKVLLIDVRTRAQFDREHIKANAVVCIEPSVLMREGYVSMVLLLVVPPNITFCSVTADTLENSMVVGPRQEASLFSNRDKFDLVAVYDDSSTSFGSENSPLATLVRAISEQAFRKMLKRMPMMLVGGIEAWKKDLGETELVRGPGYMEIERPVPRPTPISLASSPNARQTTFGTTSLVASNSTGNSHEVRPSRSKGEGVGHHVSMSLDQSAHTRYVAYKLIYTHSDIFKNCSSPADSGYGPIPRDGDRPLARRPAVLRPSSSSISFTRSLNDTVSPNSSCSKRTRLNFSTDYIPGYCPIYG